jgi:hypothetical protein
VGRGVHAVLTVGWLLGWGTLAHTLLSGLSRFALSTPDISTLPALKAVWQVSLGLSAGLAALLLAAAGGVVALPVPIGPALDVRALALRAIVAVLAASQSLALIGWLIRMTNLADAAVAQNRLVTLALAQPAPAPGILALLLAIVPYMALLIVLAVIYAVRLVELFVLAAVAPLALVCAMHPAADSVARAWAAELLAVLLLQPAQALLLVLFQVALVDVTRAASAPEALVSSLALLYLTLRLPGWLRRFAHSAGQEGASALLARAAARRAWRAPF